jgi:hypothetical protein
VQVKGAWYGVQGWMVQGLEGGDVNNYCIAHSIASVCVYEIPMLCAAEERAENRGPARFGGKHVLNIEAFPGEARYLDLPLSFSSLTTSGYLLSFFCPSCLVLFVLDSPAKVVAVLVLTAFLCLLWIPRPRFMHAHGGNLHEAG